MTNAFSAQRIATALLAARAGGTAAELPAEAINGIDLPQGFEVQELVAKQLAWPVAAWKVAVAPDGTVLSAPIFDNLFFQAPATLPLALCGQCGLECEIAFRIDRAMPARSTPYSHDDVAANISSACVTVEVLTSRLPAKFESPRNAQLADLLSNAAVIAGAPVAEWRGRDFKTIPVALTVDGKSIVARNGGHPNGDPFGAVVALANDLPRRGMSLAAGAVVTTGSYTGVHFTPKGGDIQVRFEGFPELRFAIA